MAPQILRQPSLLDESQRIEHPWKLVRSVSRQMYAELRRNGSLGASTRRALVGLAGYRNRYQEWPTPAELTRFIYHRKRIARDDTKLVAPRLTEFVRGRVVTIKGVGKVRKGGGLCTLLTARRCRVTGHPAHPVAIREAGSLAREIAA
mgnify:CR=1 FL=1